MRFLDSIIEWFYSLAVASWDAYQEVKGWVWPLHLLSEPLYDLHWAFYNLYYYFGEFNEWLTWASDRINDILSIWDIFSLTTTWRTYASAAWAWVLDAWWNVWDIVDSWWSTTSLTVQAWIDQAIYDVNTLGDQVVASLGDLRSSWEDFLTLTWPSMVADLGGLRVDFVNFLVNILPGLATWTGVNDLVESTMRSWFPFYDDLVIIWDDVAEFFTDPWEWLLSRFTDWFLGPEG